jgi:hypothetical protein
MGMSFRLWSFFNIYCMIPHMHCKVLSLAKSRMYILFFGYFRSLCHKSQLKNTQRLSWHSAQDIWLWYTFCPCTLSSLWCCVFGQLQGHVNIGAREASVCSHWSLIVWGSQWVLLWKKLMGREATSSWWRCILNSAMSANFQSFSLFFPPWRKECIPSHIANSERRGRLLCLIECPCVSWLLANTMSEPSCCFWKCHRNSGHRLCKMFCSEFCLIIICNARHWELWSQWIVMGTAICDEGDGLKLREQLL